MIIDCDIHHAIDPQALLRRMPRGLADRGLLTPGMPGFGNPHGVSRRDATPTGGGAAGSNPDFLLEHHIEALGIDFGLLHPGGLVTQGTNPDYRYAAAICSAYNDLMLETWLEHDPRFLGALLIPLQWPEAAAREIRRVGASPRFVSIIAASATSIPLGNAHYWPIYEAACELGLPLGVHPGAEGRGVTGAPSPAGWPSSYFEWHTDLSQNYMAQVASLVIEGVFQEFPDLRFVAIEGGFAWLPHLMWRLDKNWKALRETVPWLTEPPSATIRKHIRLTTQPMEEPEKPDHLLQIFEMIAADQTLMFSSDYPHWDGDDPRYCFPSKMSSELRDRIFYQTAAELYGLPMPETTATTP